MNKTAIKNFAIWARNKLIADVSYDARLIGITEDGIAKPLPQSFGDTQFFDIGTAEPYSISGEAVRQRNKLVEVIKVRTLEESAMIGRELMLIKVSANNRTREPIMTICQICGARVTDLSPTSMTMELTDTPERLNAVYGMDVPAWMRSLYAQWAEDNEKAPLPGELARRSRD